VLKMKLLSLASLVLALVAFAEGKTKTFSWQQFITALAISIMGLYNATMLELYPPQQEGAAPAPPAPQ